MTPILYPSANLAAGDATVGSGPSRSDAWCNWLSSFEGARLSEIADAHTRDIVLAEGVWVMKTRRNYRSPDQRLKTVVSTRDVSLHSAVIAEGFLDYVKSVGDGPLFAQARLDGYGRRAGQAIDRD